LRDVVLISSRANERVKAVRALRDKKARDTTGTFFAEGWRLVDAALTTGTAIDLAVIAPDRLDDRDEALAARLAGSNVPVLEVTGEVFDSLGYREEGQGLGIVVQQRWESLDESTGAKRCWVALSDIQHPGNLGTIVRNNDAIGGDGVILSGTSTDPYHPVAVRGSLGAIFSQRIVRASQQDVATWAKRGECTVIGTSPEGTVDYREADYASKPVLLISGSERIGISGAQMALCDAVVRIPMSGLVESLNLSIATGLVQFEILRQNP
jgi:RNA methyltransferase, TrmH family